jgi:hypothetical protein
MDLDADIRSNLVAINNGMIKHPSLRLHSLRRRSSQTEEEFVN